MGPQQAFPGSPVKVSSIIGASIVNPSRVSLGKIKEVVIDPVKGQVTYAVISFGGFVGLGEKLFAIPFSAFTYHANGNEYVLNVSQERLRGAPGFDADRWPAMSDNNWNRDLSGYYDRSPYWE